MKRTRVCEDSQFVGKFEWRALLEVAREPAVVSKEPGIYSLRVKQQGLADVDLIISRYLKTPYMEGVKRQDSAIAGLYALMSLPPSEMTNRMWSPDDFGKAQRRLKRLRKLSGEWRCPILYLGCTNNLNRRFDELVWGGHTANHAVWPLLVANWELEYGSFQTGSYEDDEKRLKDIYKKQHGGTLPPLMRF